MENTLTICTFKDLQNFIPDNFFEFLHDAGITLCVCQNKNKKTDNRTSHLPFIVNMPKSKYSSKHGTFSKNESIKIGA